MRRRFRRHSLAAGSEEAQLAALEYVLGLPLENAAVLPLLHDWLYSRHGRLRLRAAQELADRGEARWLEPIAGTGRDFDRLANIAVPEDEAALREILRHDPPSAYAIRLRKILYGRAR